MDNNCETQKQSDGFAEELLSSFALFLSAEIKQFYKSEEGKKYYEQWRIDHPEN